MSAGWQAFFWFIALVLFIVDGLGVIITVRGAGLKLQSLALAFFTLPWFWTAWDASR